MNTASTAKTPKGMVRSINGTLRRLKTATLTTNGDGTRMLVITHACGRDLREIPADLRINGYTMKETHENDGPVDLIQACRWWAAASGYSYGNSVVFQS